MKFLLAIGIIAIIALIGSRVSFHNRSLPLGIRHILFTGTEYIFIGVLLGEWGLNLLDGETLLQLESIMLFCLAWIGLLFGLQFEIRLLQRLPKYYFSITAIQSSITFVLVASASYLMMTGFSLLPDHMIGLVALVLGAMSACTAQSAIAIVNKNYRIQNRQLLELMRYIAGVDGVFALLFFAIALSLSPLTNLTESYTVYAIARWLLVSIVIGVIPGMLFVALSKTRFSNQEFTLFLVGTILFCGGLAQQLHYSPLFSGMVCGFLTANLCRHRLRAIQIVAHAEKSIYILLLLIVGAYWELSLGTGLMIGIGYFSVRLTGKFLGALLATRVFRPQYEVPSIIGLGLISEGGLAIAIVLNFHYLFPSIADVLITVIVFSVILNELLSPRLIMAQFKPGDINLRTRKNQTSEHRINNDDS